MADDDGKPKQPDPIKPDDDPKAKKIEITQEKLDALVDKAFARGAKNSKDAQEVAAMQRELDELRGMKAWLEEAAKKDKDGKGGDNADAKAEFQRKLEEARGEYDKRLKTLESAQKEKETKLSTQVSELHLSGLRADVLSGIAGAAADAEEVFTLLNAGGHFRFDEESGKYVVIDPKKKSVLLDVDADGEPLAPGKYAVQWLEEHPRHKRASGRTGSGQGAGDKVGGEGPSSGINTSDMKPSEMFAKRFEIVDDLKRRAR